MRPGLRNVIYIYIYIIYFIYICIYGGIKFGARECAQVLVVRPHLKVQVSLLGTYSTEEPGIRDYPYNLTTTLFWQKPGYRQVDYFVLNDQPDALTYPNSFCYKTLHVSGIFSAHHQEFSTVHSALVSFMHVLITASKQSQDGNAVPSWLCMEAVIKNLHETSILTAWKRSSNTCMKLTSADFTVENSWWWAEKMPETCRVLWQSKFG